MTLSKGYMAPKTADNRLSKHRRQSTEKGERIVKATTVPFCPGRKRLITINFYLGLFQIEYYKNLCQTNSDIFPNFLLGDRLLPLEGFFIGSLSEGQILVMFSTIHPFARA